MIQSCQLQRALLPHDGHWLHGGGGQFLSSAMLCVNQVGHAFTCGKDVSGFLKHANP